MIYDVCSYNGETELFEIRYNILKDWVDEFRVVEFDKTFSGKPKERLFNLDLPRVKHYFIRESVWGDYRSLAIESPNTQYGRGAKHWITEFCQKESIKTILTDLPDATWVFIGDCDEIYDMQSIPLDLHRPAKLKLKVYSYWLNNRSNEEFWGTLFSSYEDIKNSCLNELRSNAPKTDKEYGWHFTSQGGYENVKNKLLDSYSEDSYANPSVMKNLKQNINDSRDFLGRRFDYRLDESEWPSYLKDNKSKYKHLLK